MRVVAVHNYYRQRGGEDEVYDAETTLLTEHGHEVIPYVERSSHMEGANIGQKIGIGLASAWNARSRAALESALGRERPDVVHIHNTFPLISASILSTCRKARVPVVATIHNYRLACANGLFMRDGRPCEQCKERAFPWPAIIHACYHDSRAQSAGVAFGVALHRWLGTWVDNVDVFVALTEFSKLKLIECGIPASKLTVKPNFCAANSLAAPSSRDYAIFVGRLSGEKGIAVLIDAWQRVGDIPLRIVGDGPMLESLREFAAGREGQVSVMGRRDRGETLELIRGARFLLVPSIWYEGFPMVVIEAFSQGVPVIASELGSLAEVVEDGVTGLHFEAGDSASLSQKVRRLWERPEEAADLGANAKRTYKARYTPERNYQSLMSIYERAARDAGVTWRPEVAGTLSRSPAPTE